MRRINIFVFLLVAALLLSSCNNTGTKSAFAESASAREYNVLSVLFHEPYLDFFGIRANYSSERKGLMKKIEKALSEEPSSVTIQKGGWFSNDYYALTANKYGSTFYYGKIKDNKPDGFGVLTNGKVDLAQLDTIGGLIYAGDFSKGRFDGYGAKFYTTYSSDEQYVDSIIEEGNLDASYRELAVAYLKNYVSYDGQWKDGEMEGKGNVFLYMADRTNPVQTGYWGGPCYPASFFITTVKNDQCSGSTKEYEYGLLIYDGEMKDGYRKGKGVSYYYNGQKKYDGKWSSDKYNGAGKLYDENGKLVYSGKWKDGDYAS